MLCVIATVKWVKEDDAVGPLFGLGDRNKNGQCVVDCCQRHYLMVASTWFQAKTWSDPNGHVKSRLTTQKLTQCADCNYTLIQPQLIEYCSSDNHSCHNYYRLTNIQTCLSLYRIERPRISVTSTQQL